MNKKQKGAKYVNEALSLYNLRGYTTWKPGSKAHFIGAGRVVSQSQDILECADFIAVKQDDKVHLVQVTTATDGSTTNVISRREKIDAVQFNLEHTTLRVMARIPKRPYTFRVWERRKDGWEEISDDNTA